LTRTELDRLRRLLDQKVEEYNNSSFIENDPISIPHRYSKKQDIEIAAFWTAMLSWGQRKTIINKATQLMSMMDDAPHAFMLHHQPTDLKPLLDFKHRTFLSDIVTMTRSRMHFMSKVRHRLCMID